MSSLIHAVVTVSGDRSLLDACAARMQALLDDQAIDGEVDAHHGPDALRYDLNVKGGIPFPAFAMASQAFPALRIDIEWIDVEAGARGAATILGGKLAGHSVGKLATGARSTRHVYVSVAESGRLQLALTFFRSSRDEWLGYALDTQRDALLRVVRAPDSDEIELFATEGSAEWSLRWRGSRPRLNVECEVVRVLEPIDKDVYSELEQLAQGFVADWVWFSSESEEKIAIERERYARAGIGVNAANVRSVQLHRMRSESAAPAGELLYSTLETDEMWIKDIVAHCWASQKA